MNKSNFRLVSNQTGFTLIEILIAIFLLAFVSIGIVSITSDSQQTKERTVEKDRDNLQIETALSRFEWDFSQIYSPLYFSQQLQLVGDPNGQQQVTPEQQQVYEAIMNRYLQMETFAFSNQDGIPVPRFHSEDKSSFEFFTSSNRRKMQNQKQSNFAWVLYSLVDTPESQNDDEVNPNAGQITKTGKSFARFIQADDPYGDKRIDKDKLKAQILLNNVESVEFQFWNPQTLKFETNLQTIQNGFHLLRGIKLIISWYDKAGIKRTATKIYRPLWPAVVPQDQQTNQAASGQSTGTATNGQGSGQAGTPDQDEEEN